MIKDILVGLVHGVNDCAQDYSLSLARLFDAHVTAVSFAYEPAVPPVFMGGVSVDYITQQREANVKVAADTKDRFISAAQNSGQPFDVQLLSSSYSDCATVFGQLARRFDLAVVGQPHPESIGVDEMLIEGVLFESGRPALAVPYGFRVEAALNTALVAWDGSEQAARALHDALPLLRMSKKIQVLSLSKSRDITREGPSADIALHLARHGLNVDAKHEYAHDGDVTKALINAVIALDADFMVMGGYGHSRLRQFMLGGTTRGIPSKMTVPVLMAH